MQTRPRRLPTLVIGVLVLAAGFAAVTPIHAAARPRPACTITGTRKDDRLRGTVHADVICARGGDRIIGGPGQDLTAAGPGDDVVRGGGGSDFDQDGQAGNDRVFGGVGRDDVRGGPGRDRIVGGRGSDTCLSALDGSPGDVVFGGPGNDRGDRDAGDDLHSVEQVTQNVCFGE